VAREGAGAEGAGASVADAAGGPDGWPDDRSGESWSRPRAVLVGDLVDDLNPVQRQAVSHEGGPLLVVAGAGSGKTRVLTRRIAYLVGVRGVAPSEILAITFTNKAAAEMRARLVDLLGPVAERMWVSTFHAAAARILRSHAADLGYRPGFSIYDAADSLRLMTSVVREAGLDPKRHRPRALLAQLSRAKNELRSLEEVREAAQSQLERQAAEALLAYQRRLFAANAMDFDDLLAVLVGLFKGHPEVLARWQRRFQHVLVDEYQDTNVAQARLVGLLAGAHGNVMVVGDSDQSVYRFRGADIRNILLFERAFPATTTLVLEQNYRSTQTILDAANALIAHNTTRQVKRLWSERGAGEPITWFHAEDERAEAAFLAEEIERERRLGRNLSEIAVFYRTNAQSRALEEELVRRGVPYRVVGSVRFYERREVKDALAWLRLVANPDDELSFRRAMAAPRRGVGETTVDRLVRLARSEGRGLGEVLDALGGPDGEEVASTAGLTGRAHRALAEVAAGLRRWRERAREVPPDELADAVLTESGYVAALEAEAAAEAAGADGRLETLAELVGEVGRFPDLSTFLAATSLVSDADEIDATDGRVVLMTLHLAKGLEFPIVAVVGLEEGVFPHSRALGDPDELEEERRLAYVGVTRAKERLYLTSAWRRSLWGAPAYNPRSRFLDELPSGLLRRHPASFAPERDLAGSDGGSTWRTQVVEAALARRRTPVRTRGADALGLSPGDDVVHATFGEGVVISIRGEAERAEAVVRFPGLGEKVLALAYAPLKRA